MAWVAVIRSPHATRASPWISPAGAEKPVVGAELGGRHQSHLGHDDRRMTLRLIYLLFCNLVLWLAVLCGG